MPIQTTTGNKQSVKSFDEMTDKQVDNYRTICKHLQDWKHLILRAAVLSKVAFDERENSFINFDHLRNG
jgi:DnaJ-domain-containing protein 1